MSGPGLPGNPVTLDLEVMTEPLLVVNHTLHILAHLLSGTGLNRLAHRSWLGLFNHLAIGRFHLFNDVRLHHLTIVGNGTNRSQHLHFIHSDSLAKGGIRLLKDPFKLGKAGDFIVHPYHVDLLQEAEAANILHPGLRPHVLFNVGKPDVTGHIKGVFIANVPPTSARPVDDLATAH